MSVPQSKQVDTLWDSWVRPIIDFAAFPIDTIEEKGHFTIKADLPGISKTDVNVTHTNGSIYIRASRKCQDKSNSEYKRWLERPCGEMERVIRLPAGIDEQSMQANLDNGVLTVTARKSKESSQTINIL